MRNRTNPRYSIAWVEVWQARRVGGGDDVVELGARGIDRACMRADDPVLGLCPARRRHREHDELKPPPHCSVFFLGGGGNYWNKLLKYL